MEYQSFLKYNYAWVSYIIILMVQQNYFQICIQLSVKSFFFFYILCILIQSISLVDTQLVDDLHFPIVLQHILLNVYCHTVIHARAPDVLMEHLNIPDKDALSRLFALKWGFPRV